jgi:hypothetical protein
MTREQGTYLEPDLDAVAVAPPGRPALGAFFCYTASKGRSSMILIPGRPAISDRKVQRTSPVNSPRYMGPNNDLASSE